MTHYSYEGQCLTVIGTVSIQPYIFRSNKLREMIGASYLVNYWLDDGLITEMNLDCSAWDSFCNRQTADTTSTKTGEVVYIGGGKAVLLFKNIDIAKKAVFSWSRKILKKSPGIRFAVGHANVQNGLYDAYTQAMAQLIDCENALPFGSPLLALPVVRNCNTTGLPASAEGESAEYISSEAQAKREQTGSIKNPGPARKKMEQDFSAVLHEQNFAWKFEDLGGEQGESHIAVIHADGNEIGEFIQKVAESSQDQGDDALLENLRNVSSQIKRTARISFQNTLQWLAENLPHFTIENHPLDFVSKNNIFPVSPIVYGGDDLTFVCDGRIGLPLAVYYLKQFSNNSIEISGKKISLTSCAGVAIVPTKFPFARAYHLAEELCQSAKESRRNKKDEEGCWLDFHISLEGITGSLEWIREHHYCAKTGDMLYLRPYKVTDKEEQWKEFVNILRQFKEELPRSRSKKLLQALKQGPEATKEWIFKAKFRGFELPQTESDRNAAKEGWGGGVSPKRVTPYFDPLEALDFYIDLSCSGKKGD